MSRERSQLKRESRHLLVVKQRSARERVNSSDAPKSPQSWRPRNSLREKGEGTGCWPDGLPQALALGLGLLPGKVNLQNQNTQTLYLRAAQQRPQSRKLNRERAVPRFSAY